MNWKQIIKEPIEDNNKVEVISKIAKKVALNEGNK